RCLSDWSSDVCSSDLRLDTEKNISRAAKELNEALGLPERLTEGLRGLAAAMTEMQERQKAALEPLGECAANVESRTRRLGEHMRSEERRVGKEGRKPC